MSDTLHVPKMIYIRDKLVICGSPRWPTILQSFKFQGRRGPTVQTPVFQRDETSKLPWSTWDRVLTLRGV